MLLGNALAAGLLLTSGVWLGVLEALTGSRWPGVLVAWVLVPAACAAGLGIFLNVWPRDYGFRSLPDGWSGLEQVMAFLAAGIALLGTFYVATHLSWEYLWSYAPPAQVPTEAMARLRFWITAAILAPVVEEAVFRGLPWLYVSTRFPGRTAPYVIGTAVIFGMAHWTHGPHGVVAAFALGLVAAFALGLVAAYLYARFENLWPLVAGHAATNIGMNL